MDVGFHFGLGHSEDSLDSQCFNGTMRIGQNVKISVEIDEDEFASRVGTICDIRDEAGPLVIVEVPDVAGGWARNAKKSSQAVRLDLRKREDRERLEGLDVSLPYSALRTHVTKYLASLLWDRLAAVMAMLKPVTFVKKKEAQRLTMDFLDKSRGVCHDSENNSGSSSSKPGQPPSGGWRWRPVVIDLSLIAEFGRDLVHVRFTDAEGGELVFHTDENPGTQMAKYKSKSGSRHAHHSFRRGSEVYVKWFDVGEDNELVISWVPTKVIKVTEYFIHVEKRCPTCHTHKRLWLHVIEDEDRINV